MGEWQPVKTSHTGRNIAVVAGVIVVAVVLLAALGLFSNLNAANNGGSGNSNQQPVSQNIVNGLITVNAGSYEDYQFTIPSGIFRLRIWIFYC
jgi:hypothetical protein